jgi:hypothetical protein
MTISIACGLIILAAAPLFVGFIVAVWRSDPSRTPSTDYK